MFISVNFGINFKQISYDSTKESYSFGFEIFAPFEYLYLKAEQSIKYYRILIGNQQVIFK